MTYQTIAVEIENGVATIWLNRPEVRNAFNEISIAEITESFHTLDQNAQVRAIVLAAKGPAFCAGADLNWMKKMAGYTYEQNLADAGQLAEMLRTIHSCRKPTIAKVQGDCYAGGMGLVSACGIVVAVETANFCLSEVKIGLIPATIAPYVIRAMGERPAQRYFTTAERFTAKQAKDMGFVHESVPAEELDSVVGEIVKSLLGCGPEAVMQAKKLVRDIAGIPLTSGLIADTVQRIAAIRASDEGKEGVKAFLEKRKPEWAAQQS